MRKMFLITLVLVLLLSATAAAAAGVSVYVDEEKVSFPDQEPYIDKNSRTLVPIRFIAEEMGAEVGWDGAIELVTIEKDDTLIKLTIGEQRAQVNGAWKTFDTNAVLYNNRTVVPLRFISETLGAEVEWNGATRTVYIYTGKPITKPITEVITPYTGAKPVNPTEWKMASGTAEVMRWDNPVIKYITMDDLPAELNSLKVMDITVDDKFVNVKFKTTGHPAVPNMFLAEGNDLTRVRNYKNIEVINNETYIQKYDIIDSFDTHRDLGKLPTEADIKKITHFIFDGYRNDQTRLLAVENPYFGGK